MRIDIIDEEEYSDQYSEAYNQGYKLGHKEASIGAFASSLIVLLIAAIAKYGPFIRALLGY